MKVLIVYDSRTGNTESMAHYVEEGVKAEGVDVDVMKIENANVDDIPQYRGLILGSPVYYGCPPPGSKST